MLSVRHANPETQRQKEKTWSGSYSCCSDDDVVGDDGDDYDDDRGDAERAWEKGFTSLPLLSA